jgi:NAD(P)-dependent dehydrogenase (short-subunit alcohol dehydrogenase family)
VNDVSLEGRVAIVTGAGAGLGRAEALGLVDAGAAIVLNDLPGAADDAADEIRARGGRVAVVEGDVGERATADAMIAAAVDDLGSLDIVVNNAGMTRDRMLFNLSDEEWDDVIRVHLRGHFCPTRHAAAYWREESKAGRGKPRHVVNTSSTSGLMANPGQSNYGAAKSGIATFTQITAKELARYDVKVNCIAPAARTRMTLATPGLSDIMAAREGGGFDEWDPGNVSPLVAYLASTACRFTGETFYVQGGVVQRVRSWEMAESVRNDKRWDVAELAAALEDL